MTIAETRFMERLPHHLNAIAKTLDRLTPRLVKVTENSYINPAEIQEMWVDPKSGIIYLTMRNDAKFKTFFKTPDEAKAAFGMEIC